MREVRRRKSKKAQFKEIILNHIYENAKAYLIIIILFIIGIVAGVIFINNVNESQASEIQSYINGFIDSLKQDYHIDKAELLKKSLWNNCFIGCSKRNNISSINCVATKFDFYTCYNLHGSKLHSII